MASDAEPGPRRRLRVAAVDDHQVVIRGIAAELAEQGIDLVASAGSVDELLGGPVGDLDVVLLDLQLDDDRGVATDVRALQAVGCSVLVYTANPLDARARAALIEGALGVVGKHRTKDLVDAVRLASTGEPFFSREFARHLAANPMPQPALSPQERDVVRGVAEGMEIKQVARRMSISPETVKVYLRRARNKYLEQGRDAETRAALWRRAVEDGLVDPPEEPPLDVVP